MDAFVLGGGGQLGVSEVGMLRALLERGHGPDLVVGTSVGAINGAAIASDPTVAMVQRLQDTWSDIERSDVFAGSFMAHFGFPDGFGQVWRDLPEPTPIVVQMWHVPAGEIPAGTEARIDWLFGCWRTLDAWVAEQRQASSTASLRAMAAGRVR